MNTEIDQDMTLPYMQVCGEPEPEVKWLVSGVELAESDKYHMERHETTYTLTIYEITVDDTEMTYSCKVSCTIYLREDTILDHWLFSLIQLQQMAFMLPEWFKNPDWFKSQASP